MTTKKELEKRITALEAEVALLRARPITVPYYPSYYPPYKWWTIQGSGIKGWDGSVVWNSENASAATDAIDRQQRLQMMQYAGQP